MNLKVHRTLVVDLSGVRRATTVGYEEQEQDRTGGRLGHATALGPAGLGRVLVGDM